MTVIQTTSYHRDALLTRFRKVIAPNPDLDRRLVSYQADKETPLYRWFKYREGFTVRLVQYLLEQVHPLPGVLLDPFAGSGTALFGAAALGWTAHGIEVLPVGCYAVQGRRSADLVDPDAFAAVSETLKYVGYADHFDTACALQHIAITRGALPVESERDLGGYIAYCNKHIHDEHLRRVALFAAFCVLEDISFTRKDGQYLRWDERSGRSQGAKPFNKGVILPFARAISEKLDQIAYDLKYGRHFHPVEVQATLAIEVAQGSCLEQLPLIGDGSIDAILTSPPYCNRYDYTRTYALELVFLHANHESVTKLRQAMLSCTVENKSKRDEMRRQYAVLGRQDDFVRVDTTFESQPALQEVLSILDKLRDAGQLNNPNIARMVRNYFYEMCFVIFEMARVLAPGGHVMMVNDNVQYAGEEVPVDLILSSVAEEFGLETERIWTLARGKGNSSQQMGIHGRTELRKCVYVWRKPID